MAIKSLEERKKQNTLLIVAIVVFIIVVFIVALVILYFSFWQKKTIITTESEQLKPAGQLSNIILEEKLKKIDLDTNFLINKIIPFLKSHGDLPVRKGVTGKPNPFVP